MKIMITCELNKYLSMVILRYYNVTGSLTLYSNILTQLLRLDMRTCALYISRELQCKNQVDWGRLHNIWIELLHKLQGGIGFIVIAL